MNCINVLYQCNFRACLQLKINFGLGPVSGLYFWAWARIAPTLVVPLQFLRSENSCFSFLY